MATRNVDKSTNILGILFEIQRNNAITAPILFCISSKAKKKNKKDMEQSTRVVYS
jgi:hypothetical protein